MFKKGLFLFFLSFAFASYVLSQTPTPTASPVQPANDDGDVVKISTTLIQVDVTVTDGKGVPIKDLKPEEVQIYENGQKQNITNFSFVSNDLTVNEPVKIKNEKSDPLAVAPPPMTIRPEQVKRTIALVVDDLTLSFESVYYVKRALKKFVDEQMRDGDLVAIIRTGAGIGALQQFTADKRQLYAAIDKVRWNPAGSGKIGAFSPIESTPLEKAKASGADVSDEELAAEKNSIQSNNDFRNDIFATGTLGALNFIVKGMKELPGRKSVMLMSDGFKLYTQGEDGFKDTSRVFNSLKVLIDLANRSSVVVYTMDARGLQTLGLSAEDDTSDLSGEQTESKLSDRRDELFDTQDGLNYLAHQTGGLAIRNNNDLSGGIRKMLNDQSYYLVAYAPDAETFDPLKRKFNKFAVKVTRPGAHVRYRSGFFGVADDRKEDSSATAKLTPSQRIGTALTSPFAVSDINLHLNTIFGSDAKQGAFINSLLHVDVRDLKFTDEPDGGKKAVLDLIVLNLGDNGIVLDKISKIYTVSFSNQETYQKYLDKGFVYSFSFPVKKPGAFQMRAVVRDEGSDKIGSASQFIEVPNLKKNRLTLSGVVLADYTAEQWSKSMGKNPNDAPAVVTEASPDAPDSLRDTSLREFKRGTILTYGYEIYNAKSTPEQKPNLTTRIRIFRDGKLTFDGKPNQFSAVDQTDFGHLKMFGALNLGTEMNAGDYVLQIIVTDGAAKDKQKNAVQFVPFEIID